MNQTIRMALIQMTIKMMDKTGGLMEDRNHGKPKGDEDPGLPQLRVLRNRLKPLLALPNRPQGFRTLLNRRPLLRARSN